MPVPPPEGVSMLPTWAGAGAERPALFWEHEGNCAVRRGRWKLVRKFGLAWELYDLDEDRTELDDLATEHPHLVVELAREYDEWAARCGVIPRQSILDRYARLGGER
jgi:arylsulfatase A-like enzyme